MVWVERDLRALVPTLHRRVFQPPDNLCGTTLDSLWQVHIPFTLGASELNTVKIKLERARAILGNQSQCEWLWVFRGWEAWRFGQLAASENSSLPEKTLSLLLAVCCGSSCSVLVTGSMIQSRNRNRAFVA